MRNWGLRGCGVVRNERYGVRLQGETSDHEVAGLWLQSKRVKRSEASLGGGALAMALVEIGWRGRNIPGRLAW